MIERAMDKKTKPWIFYATLKILLESKAEEYQVQFKDLWDELEDLKETGKLRFHLSKSFLFRRYLPEIESMYHLFKVPNNIDEESTIQLSEDISTRKDLKQAMKAVKSALPLA